MKKSFLLTLLVANLFFISTKSFAFSDIGTHPAITEAAAKKSVLGCDGDGCTYLKNNLGFNKKLDEAIGSNTIRTILMNGSSSEDTGISDPGRWSLCSRGLNHFYDPTKSINDTSAGLDEWTYEFAQGSLKSIFFPMHWSGKSNLLWATSAGYSNLLSVDYEPSEDQQKDTDYNCYSWRVAREAFLKALTAKDTTDRNRYFARMFRSVGQIVHLIQDMAVPAHVRNDMKGHLYFQQFALSLPSNWLGNNFEAYVLKKGIEVQAAYVPSFSKITDFWDTDFYNGWLDDSIGTGLSEYTQANFLSEFSMMGEYLHPSISDGFDYETPEAIQERDGKFDNRFYFKKTEGEPVDHLMAESYLGEYLQTTRSNSLFLDEKCYADYAAKLVPKAIGYSAGLINYFFRGTLEISRPDRYVYSIIDGSLDPQQFTYIKAKVRNSTDYNNGPDAPMGPGTLWAVAKYKKRTNYDPDLANDPPTAGDREENFSYSVSVPIDGVNLGVDFQEFEFDFSGDPIPAGITDLYLQVVYQGTLGQETNTAVAVGMKDLSEPTHFVVYNATDYVFFEPVTGDTENLTLINNNLFNTAENMEQGGPMPAGCHINEDGTISCSNNTTLPRCVYPYDPKLEIEFSPYIPETATLTPHVTYNPLPAGRHGRIIILCDNPPAIMAYIDISSQQDDGGNNVFPFANDHPCTYSPKRYQPDIPLIFSQDNSTTNIFQPSLEKDTFRQINMHKGFAFYNPAIYSCPEEYDNNTGLFWRNVVYPQWPVMSDNSSVEIDTSTFNP